MNEYWAGAEVKVTYTLSPLADATEVVVTWAVRSTTDGTYGPSTILRLSTGGVTRLSLGVYQVVINTTGLSGWVTHQMVATGTAQGAQVDHFEVDSLPLATP